MIFIREGDRKISFKSLLINGVSVIGFSLLMVKHSFAQISEVNNNQLADDGQFMIGLSVFFILTIFLIIWLLLKRQKSEKLFLEASEFNLPEMIDNVIRKVDERVKQKHIHLNVDYDPELTTVKADPKRIQHSVSNLLSNAVKFTSESGHIDVRTWQDEQNYFISIRDDGIGIEPDEKEEIFEKFYTGSNVPKGKGTGLGLSLVKIFVEIHGGEVIVESDLGIGSELTCRLPKELPEFEDIQEQGKYSEIPQLLS
ncbi:HAMP domain-containing histidine kinase [Emcibacteraceae bacterium]|nr:HAMP domain-containing histidine kinase [Emcibacteraceae bacterium]